MKIRTDFVTNSSSSGFVLIHVQLRNGYEYRIEADYEGGYGSYLSDSDDFEASFRNARSGDDLLNAILDNMTERRILEYDKQYPMFSTMLKAVRSTTNIKCVTLKEVTHFEDGSAPYRFSLKHEFPSEDLYWVIDELKRRYPNGSGFKSITPLKKNNSDLPWDSLKDNSIKMYGRSLTEVLRINKIIE